MMRRKFTILLFSLLLAVGWTNSAQAQNLRAEAPVKQFTKAAMKPQVLLLESDKAVGSGVLTHSHPVLMPKQYGIKTNAPLRAGVDLDMKSITKAEADTIRYSWDNGDGQGSRYSYVTEVAKDPYQMYALLRKIYTDPRFPGPTYSAFTKNDVRERKVYYGAIEGGWNITGPTLTGTTTTTNPVGDIQITFASGNADFRSITVTGNNGSTSWSFAQDGTSLPQYWSTTKAFTEEDDNSNSCYMPQGGTITVPASLLNGSTTVTVTINAKTYSSTYGSCAVTVPGATTETITITNYSSWNNYSWTVNGTTTTTTHGVFNKIPDISISGTNQYAMINSIKVYSGSTTLFSWDYDTDGTASEQSTGYWPNGMYYSSWGDYSGYGIAFNDELEAIVIDGNLFRGYSSVTVEIEAANSQSQYAASLIVNGSANNITSTYQQQQGAMETKSWPITADSYTYTEYDPDYYKPNQEGYTALIVAVKDTATQSDPENYDDTYENGFHDTPAKIINYFANNVDSIQLLTDGMRIGEASDYSIGTVFKCDGTYNKFFFLGKGQARQKADVIREREIIENHLIGEEVPFRFMFEQFSPTSGEAGSQTENFYSKMNEGNVYPVVHDCRSVIGNGHQFSMSGNTGTTAYAMTGMNFFIPDYRLKYWTDYNYYVPYVVYDEETGELIPAPEGPYVVDGRHMNPYQTESSDGNPAFDPSKQFTTPSEVAVWYAQYNQQYPPKVGLYKITLEAVAEPRTDIELTHEEGNRNYKVTLTWVSSLNEMTGHEVPQTYTLYYWDPITGEKGYLVVEGYTTVDGETGLTSLVYYVEQKAHSYRIQYVVEGRPTDTEHQQFVAESDPAYVIIPGWDDFVGLKLDHHESDFESGDMANWYRNFLTVVNEDIYNGLTVSKISQGMRQFDLYRWAIKDSVAQGEEKVATITFDEVTPDSVHYVINYVSTQDILDGPEDNPNKYERDVMGIPDQGWIRVKGNGDLVIWPNGYFVNFKSIVIKNGNDVLYEWSADNADIDESDPNLPSGWRTSPGSKMMPYIVTSSDQKVCYMEGGGYIYIPNMLNHDPAYTNLTVEIVAYTDGAHVGRIEVNDKSQRINNVSATYTWGTNENPISPAAAPRHDAKANPVESAKDNHSNATTNNK